jgi:hypothetical protein
MNDPYKPSECQLSGCDDGIFDVHLAARVLGRMLVTGQNGVVGNDDQGSGQIVGRSEVILRALTAISNGKPASVDLSDVLSSLGA